LADDFLAALEEPSHDYAALHTLRLQGKKLRYAMELFAAAFVPAFRDELYPQVAAIQEALGEINDHATACEHFLRWGRETLDPEISKALATLVDERTGAMDRKRDSFFDEWTPARRLELRDGFRRLLSPAATPGPER
jgi:CHAD domain-containing protein